jgi:hypothetical protein
MLPFSNVRMAAAKKKDMHGGFFVATCVTFPA